MHQWDFVWLGFLGGWGFFPQTVQFLIDTTGGAEAEVVTSMTTTTFTTTSVNTLAVPL